MDERGWEGTVLAAGDAAIALADLRGRCIVTTWDPDTLVQDVDVLRRIRAEFEGSLALNAWTARDGHVAVGDDVARAARAARSPGPAPPGRFVVSGPAL